MYTLIHNSQFRRSQSRPHAVSFFSTAYRRIGSTYREHVVNMLNQRRLPVQATTAIVEKAVRAFYSTTTVVSTKAVVMCLQDI